MPKCRWCVLACSLMLLVWPGRLAGAPADSVDVPTDMRAALLYGTVGVQGEPAEGRARSVPLALGLSAVVPGLGQAYNGDWIKAGVQFAVEAALLTGIYVWNAQGNDGRQAYKKYAHQWWRPLQYARWLNALGERQGVQVAVDVGTYEGLDFSEPGEWTSDERRAVQHLFDEIRQLEPELVFEATGATRSHQLPYFGEQQYYELIGKYWEFAPGWCDYGGKACGSDAEPWRDGEGGYTDYIHSTKENASSRFFEYSADHQHANDLLRRASRATALVLLNHVTAAVEAAVSARLHNVRLQSEVSVVPDVGGDEALSASLRVRF